MYLSRGTLKGLIRLNNNVGIHSLFRRRSKINHENNTTSVIIERFSSSTSHDASSTNQNTSAFPAFGAGAVLFFSRACQQLYISRARHRLAARRFFSGWFIVLSLVRSCPAAINCIRLGFWQPAVRKPFNYKIYLATWPSNRLGLCWAIVHTRKDVVKMAYTTK